MPVSGLSVGAGGYGTPVGRFAVRPGIWRLALAIAGERASRPASIGVRAGRRLESRRVGVRGRSLHVRMAAGDGMPVVLVHGVLVSGRYLLPLAAELAADHAVLVPDLPGYGLSEPPHGPLELAALADALIEACSSLGYDRVALVGNSFGAQIAVEAAVRHPAHVERLVLVGPTIDPAAPSFVRQALRWLRCGPDEHPSVLVLMARDVLDIGPRRAARLLRVMLDDAIEAKLPRVACPALVIRGTRDHVVPDGWARRVTELLPAARLAEVPGYAHMPHYSGALAVAPLLEDELSPVRRRRSAPDPHRADGRRPPSTRR